MTSTYNLARMNMFLHGIVPEKQKLRNGDTLDEDWPTDEETDFNMILMNPPYSAKWSAVAGFLQDERFSDYGVLAPKSKADYAFLLHDLYHLKSSGTMAIVLPPWGFLIHLDHLITLHQHKCEELRNIKKFMMQNMFV